MNRWKQTQNKIREANSELGDRLVEHWSEVALVVGVYLPMCLVCAYWPYGWWHGQQPTLGLTLFGYLPWAIDLGFFLSALFVAVTGTAGLLLELVAETESCRSPVSLVSRWSRDVTDLAASFTIPAIAVTVGAAVLGLLIGTPSWWLSAYVATVGLTGIVLVVSGDTEIRELWELSDPWRNGISAMEMAVLFFSLPPVIASLYLPWAWYHGFELPMVSTFLPQLSWPLAVLVVFTGIVGIVWVPVGTVSSFLGEIFDDEESECLHIRRYDGTFTRGAKFFFIPLYLSYLILVIVVWSELRRGIVPPVSVMLYLGTAALSLPCYLAHLWWRRPHPTISPTPI